MEAKTASCLAGRFYKFAIEKKAVTPAATNASIATVIDTGPPAGVVSNAAKNTFNINIEN